MALSMRALTLATATLASACAVGTTKSNGMTVYQELIDRERIDACLAAAPRILSAAQKEELCQHGVSLSDGPALCAAQAIGSAALAPAPVQAIVRLCSTARDLGPAHCWHAYARRIKPFKAEDEEFVLELCRDATDDHSASCYVEARRALQVTSSSIAATELLRLAAGCRQFHGPTTALVNCIRQSPRGPGQMASFRLRLCRHAVDDSNPYIAGCARDALKNNVDPMTVAHVCATATKDLLPQQCLLATQRKLKDFDEQQRQRLCANAATIDPVECVVRLKQVFTRTRADDRHALVVDMCVHTRDAARVVACVTSMPPDQFSAVDVVRICSSSTVESDMASTCLAQARKTLSSYVSHSALARTCEGAFSIAPVECLQAMKSQRSLGAEEAIELCRSANSSYPQQCVDALDTMTLHKLSHPQVVQLCQQATSTEPARCINRFAAGRPSLVSDFGLALCHRSLDDHPVKCFNQAPTGFSDLAKTVLCAQAESTRPAQCASVSVTRLRAAVDHAALCHRATSTAPSKCAIAAPHGMSALNIKLLCREAETELPAKCAAVVPPNLRVSWRYIATVCQGAKTLTPGHCLSHRVRAREPLTHTLIDECRLARATPSDLRITRFEYACVKLMPKCLVLVRIQVLDQFGEPMPMLSNGFVNMAATHENEALTLHSSAMPPLRGTLVVPVVNGTATFRSVYFTTPGDVTLRFHSTGTNERVTRVKIHENVEEKRFEARCNALFLRFECVPQPSPTDGTPTKIGHLIQLSHRFAMAALACEPRWVESGGLTYQGSTSTDRIYAINPSIYLFLTDQNLPREDMTPWQCLNIPEGANRSEIRRAYHRKSLEWHPDKWTSNATTLFKAQVAHIHRIITTAYERLAEHGFTARK